MSTGLKENQQDEGGGDAGEGEPVGNSHNVSLSLS
jgi:hypothetical protein